MTAKERIHRIRLMEKMEKSNVCTKDKNGTLKWTNENGDILVEAKMKERD